MNHALVLGSHIKIESYQCRLSNKDSNKGPDILRLDSRIMEKVTLEGHASLHHFRGLMSCPDASIRRYHTQNIIMESLVVYKNTVRMFKCLDLMKH